MEAWAITEATVEDLADLASLMTASPLLLRYGITHDGATAALDQAWRKHDLILVAQYAGQTGPKGFAWVIASRVLDGAAYLRLLLVAEEAQREGVGNRLLRAAEQHAREWANHLYLLATTDNVGARRFYEHHGYRHVGDLPDLVRPGIDEALYHKPLRVHGERLAG